MSIFKRVLKTIRSSVIVSNMAKKPIDNVIAVDRYEVIDPNRILLSEKPEFDTYRRHSEKEYKEFLVKAQPFIDEFLSTGKIHNPLNDNITDLNKEQAIKRLNKEREINIFKNSLLEGESISVRKTKDGKYTICGNGRHRLYVAKKHKIRLLVHVIEEEI